MASEFFHIDTTGAFYNHSSWIVAILGSVVLLVIYRALTGGSFRTGRRRTHRAARVPNPVALIIREKGHQNHDQS